ncbi:MAG: DUF3109 family protein [Bacteroidales bacterium]|nr:DUF3109 family protein [Bacteroidales bacterium]
MVQIDDKIVSIDLFRRKYCCDLSRCKGECCVEGDSGAPLDDDETVVLEEIYPVVEPMLTPEARKVIAKHGKWVTDQDGDKVTPIINGRECVYALREPDGTWKCAIEKAFYEGKISFKKPISCHLYPIRIAHYKSFDALNFHEWFVCKPAFELGQKTGTPVFKFLKEPIIRKFGEDFYRQMEEIAPELEKIDLPNK